MPSGLHPVINRLEPAGECGHMVSEVTGPQSTKEQTPVAAPLLGRVGGWTPRGRGSGSRAQSCADE